ncbi:hypothetical protein N8Y93_02675 [Litorivicinus sp.]|nr:hypothetical protein [Litorivicinus sp.]
MFDLIVPTDSQTQTLYRLLEQRPHAISHKKMPCYADHQAFVESHPYRVWYIVTLKQAPIGSVYISNENTVGLNIQNNVTDSCLDGILKFICRNHNPLPEIQSVRCPQFSINVPPTNVLLQESLSRLKRKVLQISYALDE